MKDGEMVLIAQPLLESRIGAYLESLANEVIMTAKKLGCKDELLVMLFVNKRKQQTHIALLGKSCEYIMYSGFILPPLQV